MMQTEWRVRWYKVGRHVAHYGDWTPDHQAVKAEFQTLARAGDAFSLFIERRSVPAFVAGCGMAIGGYPVNEFFR